MSNLITNIYILLFGAMLSAEISSNHFHLFYLEGQSLASKIWKLLVRAAFLIAFRGLYFAWMYGVLTHCPTFGQDWSGFAQALLALWLSSPTYGIHQLSYLFVPPPTRIPNIKPIVVVSQADRWFWIGAAIVFLLMPALVFWVLTSRC